MNNWTVRDIPAEAASAALRIPYETLASWVHRYKAPSGKRRGARMFSLQDLVTLQTARRLLSPGLYARDALAIAGKHMADPPTKDATLFVTDDGDWLGGPDDWPEENFTCVYPGQIAAEIVKRLES